LTGKISESGINASRSIAFEERPAASRGEGKRIRGWRSEALMNTGGI
jgi:hypothetical protein